MSAYRFFVASEQKNCILSHLYTSFLGQESKKKQDNLIEIKSEGTFALKCEIQGLIRKKNYVFLFRDCISMIEISK